MSEDNGQDRKDKESDDSVAKHLAEKRRALDLRTRPMEVIDDLDWDIPDFDDDDDFAAPAAAAKTKSEPVKAAEPAQTDNSPRERQKRVSSGTMMMSASAFKDAMDDESPGDELDADSNEGSNDEPVTAPSAAIVEKSADEGQRVARSASGTMMMSTEGLAAVDDDDASAERHRDASREWHREEMEAADEDDTEDAAPGARGAGGTMLISGKALAEEMVKQSDTTEKTPYEQMADDAEERHHQSPDMASDSELAQAAATSMDDGLDDTDPERRDIPRWKGQGMLYGAVISLGIGILVLVWMLFFNNG